MHEGAGFGDLALVNDKPRTASIVTATRCTLVLVEKADYNRILKVFMATEQMEKLMFLKKLPGYKSCSLILVFQNWQEYQLKPVTALIRWQEYPPDHVIVEEGSQLKNFMFIRRGTCRLYKKYVDPQTREDVLVKIKALKEYSYFGEEAALESTVFNKPVYSSYTLKCSNNPAGVQVGILSCYDARLQFLDDLECLEKNKVPLDLDRAYQIQIQRQQRLKERRKAVNMLIKEKSKDPNMTTTKWNATISSKSITWK